MKRDNPAHAIRVVERDPENATYGWGVVFSDVALAFVREIAPELYESMTRNQEVHDDMAVVHRGEHVRLARNVFHRMARIDLLRALREHCARVGVDIAFEHKADDVDEFADCDLIVAADGANSAIRTRYLQHFEPTLDVRPNYFAWYGTTRLFDPLSLIFRQNADGLLIAHTYRYSRTHSTFLVECDPATYDAAGLDRMSEADSLAYCEQVFADDLQGHPLLSNKSAWFRYTIVKNRHWSWRNVVLLGDALRTGTRRSAPERGSRCRIRSRCSRQVAVSTRRAGAARRVRAAAPAGLGCIAGRGDQEHRVVREPGAEAAPRSDLVRLRLPGAQRPRCPRPGPRARSGTGRGVREAASGGGVSRPTARHLRVRSQWRFARRQENVDA
jgi:hypothetical protein